MSKSPDRKAPKKSAKAKKARALFRAAPSKRWQDEITAGRTAYPSHLMPLSKAKILNADPLTRDNYNPIGERGEQRHMPPHCVDFEDQIDQMTPAEAEREAKAWPSSVGSCFDGRGL